MVESFDRLNPAWYVVRLAPIEHACRYSNIFSGCIRRDRDAFR